MGIVSQGPRNVQPVFLQSGDPTLERRDPDSYSGGQLGQTFEQPDIGNDPPTPAKWQIVKTDSVMDVQPYDGAVAYWLDRANYVVTTDVSVAGRGNVAGVFRDSSAPQDTATHNIGLGQICCIQKKGEETQVNFVNSPTAAPTAAGLIVIPSATDGQADCLAAGSPATYPELGKSVGTATNHFAAVALNVDDGQI
jgi:hypothetical protein